MQRCSRAVRASGFLLASALCVVAAGAEAADIYLKIEGHKGEEAAGSPAGQIEIQSFHWGPRQSTSADGSRRGGGNQMTMDDTAGREKMQPGGGGAAAGANKTITVGGGRTEGDPDRPVIAGTVPDTPASRRQHGVVTVSKEWDAATPRLAKPQDTGSVWIRVGTPWAACRAGARYPAIELGDGKASYRLSDVVVTRCASGGASLNYAKVKVRGWDPEKKED